MRINIVVNPIDINGGWSPWDKRVGGTEECVIEWAKRLKERGHEVSVYHNGQHGTYRGVSYRERRDYLAAPRGVTVNVNYPDLAPSEPTLYWTTLDTQAGRDLSVYQKIGYISEYQRQHCFDRDYPNMVWLPPGFDATEIYPEPKIPQTVLYASSPDRGLSNLLQVWPDVIKAHPLAQLIITYGGQTELPNTICLGEVTSEEMNELYRTTTIWCHPAINGELYCISGIKAQAAGQWPVFFPTMALAETVKFGTRSTQATLTKDLIDALTTHPEPSKLKFPDWETTTDILEKELLALT